MINFNELNEMIDSINNVIADVNEEAKKAHRIIDEERFNFYTEVIKPDMAQLNDLCFKIGWHDFKVIVGNLGNIQFVCYNAQNKDASHVSFKPFGYTSKDGMWTIEDYSDLLSKNANMNKEAFCRFIDEYEDHREYIQNEVVKAIQNELSKRAEKAHAELERAKQTMNEVIPEGTRIDEFR